MANYDSTKIKNMIDFQVGLRPTGAFPLDVRTMFGSLEAATAAAATAKEAGSTESLYYFGQTLTVFEEDKATQYLIQGDGSLTEVGTAMATDDHSIVSSAGILSLKGFGKEYYSFHEADDIIENDGSYNFPDNMPDGTEGGYVQLADVWYKYIDGVWTPYPEGAPNTTSWYEKVEGWKAGLEPKVASAEGGVFELAWYEPSTTTIEGVSALIAGVQGEVANFADRLGGLEKQLADMTLPEATLTAKGISRPDGETLTVADGVMSVNAVSMGKVTGLETKLAELEKSIQDSSVEEGKKVFVEQAKVVQEVNAADPTENPLSEKAFVSNMNWKTEM